MRSLRCKVTGAGFQIVRMSHWNTTLFPIVVAVRLGRRAGKDRDRRTELTNYCRLFIRLGYGTDAAKAELRKIAEDKQ